MTRGALLLCIGSALLVCGSKALRADVTTTCVAIAAKDFEIKQSGRYCLREDLHTRMSFADHPAEHWLIFIDAENVTLDLEGHVLGRGRFFRQPGGSGIELGRNAANVVIRNGVLRDFETGIYRYIYYEPGDPRRVMVEPQKDGKRLCISDRNVCTEDVTFENVTHPFFVRGALTIP